MLAQILMATSAAIVFVLGALHLLYTFRGPKLTPRDPALQARMREVSPVISRDLTMWDAWISFNATHSLGALFYGLVYGYLAVAHPRFLFQSWFLLGVGLVLLGSYSVLGKVYWFSVPYGGAVAAFVCYVAGLVVGLGLP
jgi:hypothetical protein